MRGIFKTIVRIAARRGDGPAVRAAVAQLAHAGLAQEVPLLCATVHVASAGGGSALEVAEEVLGRAKEVLAGMTEEERRKVLRWKRPRPGSPQAEEASKPAADAAQDEGEGSAEESEEAQESDTQVPPCLPPCCA